MKCKNGKTIHKRIPDSTGAHGYVFCIADCYWPTMYFVRGDNYMDAYSWFVCDERIEKDLKIQDFELKDYDENDLEFNDNGTAIDNDHVVGWTMAEWLR